ncbi:MAG: diguanylate cyclase [Frankiales bacterium]|nr:diguanylate cyclase [Frankiales bacterium]
MSTSAPSAADLVPLAERMRWLWLFRVAALTSIAIFVPAAGDRLLVSGPAIAMGTALYLLVQLTMDLLWRFSRNRQLRLFGALLVCDGIFLGWIAYAAADVPVPLRYLILVHLIVVALLASYRTGIRLAVWDSALAFLAFHVRAGNVPGVHSPSALPPHAMRDLLGFVWLFWLVVLATATFSSINERELRRRRYDLEALAELSRRVEAASSPPEVVDVLLERIAEEFGLERMALLRHEHGELSLFAVRGRIEPLAGSFSDGPGSVVRRVANTRRTLLAAGIDDDLDASLASMLPDAGNLLIVPLTVDERTTGVLIAEYPFSRGTRIERRIVDMVERFASHAALALENALLLEQVRETSVTDGLTSIANRRHFDGSLTRHLARATRTSEPCSLLLLDIDHFKRLNDTRGHQVGDDVLREVAQVLRAHARTNDVAARYGGEEFALILDACAPEEAAATAERIRSAIATALPVTVTVGVATFPVNAVQGEDLVRAADRALYDGKRAGRDCVVEAPVPAVRADAR